MKMPFAIVLGAVIIAAAIVWHRVSAPPPVVSSTDMTECKANIDRSFTWINGLLGNPPGTLKAQWTTSQTQKVAE